MSLLIAVKNAEFNYLKDKTGATSGNLSVQITKLEEAGYIFVEKGYKGKRPQTICKLTEKGHRSFNEYVKTLNTYINQL